MEAKSPEPSAERESARSSVAEPRAEHVPGSTPAADPGSNLDDTPREPPFDHADLPAIGGHIGPEPEDFMVDEVPLYAASGQGDHWFVRVRKRQATTLELRAAVAAAAGVPAADVGYAGMKDKHAVTTQWLSIPVARARPPEAWELPPAFAVLEATRHNNKLRLGHLSQNRFRIRLVELEPAGAERIAAFVSRFTSQGIANFFGSQRFGRNNDNLRGALLALGRGRLGPRAGTRGKFMASVIQSEVFNRYAIARVALGRDRLLAGDVVRFSDGRAMFTVEDAERELPRLQRGELRLTGPMVGPKMKAGGGVPLELEREALASLGLDARSLSALGRWAPGTRRDLMLWPRELSVEVAGDRSATIAFELPAGAYASLIVRTMTRQDPWLGAGAPAGGGDDAPNDAASSDEAADGDSE
jgi:tRNA pseudouridine13 synthase